MPTPPFVPHRLLSGPNRQTIFGGLGRAGFPVAAAQTHEIDVPGGDRIVLHDDRPAAWSAGDPVAVLQHGLTGTHASTYVVRIAGRLRERGVRTLRMDARGWGAGERLARLPMHAGRSEDVSAALRTAAALAPDSPLCVAGFSLGGNVVLKMLGEGRSDLPTTLVRAAAVNPAVDLEACAVALSQGAGRFYDRYFAHFLVQNLARLRRLIPDLPAPTPSRTLRTVRQFDDAVTAPWAGYTDATEYYARAAGAAVIDGIEVPTLLLAASDDPIVPVASISALDLPPAVRLVLVEHGGHLGYVGSGANGDPDRHWMDHRVVEWLVGAGGADPVR